jgi:predicted nucleotidyltransferase
MGHPMFDALPATVRASILEWTERLRETLGPDLVSILLTGGVARGDYRPGESDVNAIVVVRDITFAKLEAIAPAMQAVRYVARVEPTIMTEEEIANSCDAFPLLYDEVKRWHIVLVGRDPLAKTTVHDTHRRVRIEQELREAQIWLRRGVTDALGVREAIGGAIARKVRQVRRPLAALLAMRGLTFNADMRSVLACAGATYGVDVSALETPRETVEAAHEALTKLLCAAVRDVQQR